MVTLDFAPLKSIFVCVRVAKHSRRCQVLSLARRCQVLSLAGRAEGPRSHGGESCQVLSVTLVEMGR